MKTLLERMPAWREKFWLIPAVAVAIAAIGAELLIAVGSNFNVSATLFYAVSYTHLTLPTKRIV